MEVHSYTWIFALTIVFACYDAFGIGANDVANSFATSVASGSLKMWQACLIAVFTEFLGAILLGSSTAETVRGKIIDVELFASEPALFMLLMFCALVGSSNWVILATRLGLPVSSTHSIIGGIIGAGIAAFGPSAINWGYDSAGVARIVVSWVVSPVIAGALAAIMYLATERGILRRKDSFKWALRTIAFYFFATFLIIVFFFLYEGSPALNLENQPTGMIVGICIGVAAAIGLLAQLFFVPWVRRNIKDGEDIPFYLMFWVYCLPSPYIRSSKAKANKLAERTPSDTPSLAAASASAPGSTAILMIEMNSAATAAEGTTTDASADATAMEAEEAGTAASCPPSPPTEAADTESASAASPYLIRPKDSHNTVQALAVKAINKAYKLMAHGMTQEIREYKADENNAMHEAAIKYEDDTERLYSFLQVSTAAFASFAHGSNDVANSAGPLAAVYLVWSTGAVDITGTTPMPLWILAISGICIDLGLTLYGYHIMRSLGNRLTYQSPSRGFSMELGSMLTVLTASRLALPVSTTHCITGATAAVGLCNGDWRAVNWKQMTWNMFSWILTLPCAGLISGLLFAVMAYSPTVPGYEG